jgi:tetratricopeptide (TPR) repeat protein/tRNA A-37 threonylcarbamoyl transferase component Bud32
MLIGRHFGHIRVTEVIGQGGMGDVYGGYDEKLERKVALKVLNDDQRLDDEARERLLREARALSKLDHPNICRIHDYIETPDLDLLVLEYIDGQTLQEAMQSGLSHHEKLRISISIADVLVQAHRAGIVHRDLKPENVMLTRTGEVKVLDFGLARWLHHKRKSSDKYVAVRRSMRVAVADTGETVDTTRFSFDEVPSGVTPRREFLATAVGITLGTPIFMSPEQARGETLTPASDMFSFGLVLQILFTGQDPHPAGLTAREVMLRIARGETQPVKGAPGDVTALINRLKQLAPADRPTAVETAEKLRFLVTKRQRIARRAVISFVALVAVLGTWRYMVDLRRERAIAVIERAEAQKRRAELENMIEFMLGDLRKKLEPVGRLDILDDVGERALHYVDSLRPEVMSADDLVRNAKALSQLGEVRVQQGKLTESLVTFGNSLRLAELAVKRDPASAPAQLALATAHFWVGEVYRRQGKPSEALRHYTDYMTLAEQLARSHPANDDYQLERAYGHSSVASIYELQGDFPRALEHLRLNREIKEARLVARPEDADRQADLARTSNRIGLVLERSGDLAGARAHYESEFATYSGLTAKDPRNSQWKDRLMVSHNYLARILEMTGDLDRALELRRAELSLVTQLVARDSTNTVWQRDLAMTQMKYGDVLRLKGQLGPALVAIKDAEETMQRLLSRTETVASWRRDLGNVRTAAARAHLASGNTAAAKQEARSAIELLEPFAGTEALMPRYIAEAWLVLGDARAASGDPGHAREAWTTAAQILAPLARESRSPEVLDIMARTLLRLGRRDEAAPLIGRLQRSGYRAPDFVRASS